MNRMAYLMRMIALPRWDQKQDDVTGAADVSADAIGDLVSANNAISTWYVAELTEAEIKKAVSALASGFRALDEVSVVFLDEETVRSGGLNVSTTKGDTKIPAYAHLHRDIDRLNAASLSKMALLLLQEVWKGEIQTYTAEEISEWLVECLQEEKLNFNELNKTFKEPFAAKIRKLLKKNTLDRASLSQDTVQSLEAQWEMSKRKTNCKYEMECERYSHPRRSAS